MKLLNLLTSVYLVITLLALLGGGLYIYKKFGEEIDFELGMELDRQIEAYAERIRQGVSPEALVNERLQIVEIPLHMAEESLFIRDTIAYHDPLNTEEVQLKASRSYKIGDKHYRISYYNLVIEAEDITETVVFTMVVVFLIQLVFLGFFFRRISNRMLQPFQETLQKVQQFNFQANEPLHFRKSGIREFDQLNDFLERMTKKLLKDYRQIKEFSENISHEIHTPAAVVSGKLENLMNSEMTEEQAQLIYSAYQNNERIHRIVRSLSLLAKLENEEFETPTQIDLSEILQKNIEMLSELVILSELVLDTEIDPKVMVKIHPFVAEVMFNNLLGNAIKHNVKGGWIRIHLGGYKLSIQNSGEPLVHEATDLVHRFKKDSLNPDSVGLGLAIVNQICKTYRFRFGYSSEGGTHTTTIDFN